MYLPLLLYFLVFSLKTMSVVKGSLGTFPSEAALTHTLAESHTRRYLAHSASGAHQKTSLLTQAFQQLTRKARHDAHISLLLCLDWF